jgi:hypothetical protein
VDTAGENESRAAGGEVEDCKNNGIRCLKRAIPQSGTAAVPETAAAEVEMNKPVPPRSGGKGEVLSLLLQSYLQRIQMGKF